MVGVGESGNGWNQRDEQGSDRKAQSKEGWFFFFHLLEVRLPVKYMISVILRVAENRPK